MSDYQVSFQEFTEQLEHLLTERTHYLNTTTLPRLKDELRSFHTAYKTVYELLLKKGLVHEDPYQYEQRSAEIEIPPRDPFPEHEAADQMSIRLAAFDTQLNFLLTYYQFTIEFLSLERIRRILQLVNYIQWEAFTATSTDITTRHAAVLVQKLRQGNDTLSGKIAGSSLDALTQTKQRILSLLRELSLFHREAYKFRVRQLLLLQHPAPAGAGPQEFASHVKRHFRATMGDQPYYRDLVQEIYEEDLGPHSEQKRAEVLARLASPREDRDRERRRKEDALLLLLLESLTTLLSTSTPLREALRILNANLALYTGRKRTLWEKFKDWIISLTHSDRKGPVFELDYVDITTGRQTTESLDMGEFGAFLSRLATSMDTYRRKLQQRGLELLRGQEDEALEYLARTLEHLTRTIRRLKATETYLKTELQRTEREKILPFKNEVSQIQTLMQRSNQKRHEYIARKEEEEQLRRLGIEEE
ncbi:hypothetical protein Spith_1936 [Spirochaeta thermophila DSM 6578]|uniref:Uncharacterized protein n=1 Tax=Winmispira thermophila (strain ATCC 700085 / DSM 6578 / Z-1203) TaxID=869211 RepID=G0GDR4_WINT7|nr:hypothetical protein [Spirochaeta thermophila]AEJ62194.1 hypothetical protein Spith_1936 [Spirochaeta thermophila DSM 6578]